MINLTVMMNLTGFLTSFDGSRILEALEQAEELAIVKTPVLANDS